MLASHLEKRFRNRKSNFAMDTEIQNFIDLECPTVECQLTFVTQQDIKTYVINFPYKKTTSEDMIPDIVLKNPNSKSIVYLVNLFNTCLRFNYFTQTWLNSIKQANQKTLQADTDPLASYIRYQHYLKRFFTPESLIIYETRHSFRNTSLDFDITPTTKNYRIHRIPESKW